MKINLNADQYKELVYQLEDLDPDGEPHAHYIGRGMVGYGGEPSRDCFGWSTSSGSGLIQLALARFYLISPNGLDIEQSQGLDWDVVLDEVFRAMDEVGTPSTDSMGRDTIYYWKNVVVEPGVQDEDEDQ